MTAPRAEYLCRYPGCNRVDPYGSHSAGGYQFLCGKHDWNYDDLICFCDIASPNGIGECTNCWRPVARLHPVIRDAAVRRWPRLAGQAITEPVSIRPGECAA